jgi:hypothetical protein
MTFSQNIEVLRNTRKLARMKIRLKQDYSSEVREVRRELIPHIKTVRNDGY